MVARWLALLPHNKKAQGSNPGCPRYPLCAVCMLPPTIKDMFVRINTPVSASDHQHWQKELELVPRRCAIAAHCSYRMGKKQRINFVSV